MITLLKYAISIALWAVIGVVFLIAGNPALFAFWCLFGLFLLVLWFFKVLWKWFVGIFFPALQLRAYILLVVLFLVAVVLVVENLFIPKMNTWGLLKDELSAEYPVDEFLPDAKTITTRGITVEAAPKEVYPFVTQLATEGLLKFNVNLVDLLTNKPAKMLVSDLPPVNIGDRFLVGDVVQAKGNQSITIELDRRGFPWNKFKAIYAGYYLRRGEHGSTRIIVRVKADYDGTLAWFAAKYLIEIVDFFVSRYQLQTVKALVEKQR